MHIHMHIYTYIHIHISMCMYVRARSLGLRNAQKKRNFANNRSHIRNISSDFSFHLDACLHVMSYVYLSHITHKYKTFHTSNVTN